MRLFVVRHGESGWNLAGRLQGQALDAPGLTRRGVAQAEAAADGLVGCGATVVVASRLRRATETGAIVARRLAVPLALDDRLAERHLGAAEGAPVDGHPPGELGVAAGLVVDPDAAPAGGESVRQLVARVEALLADLAGCGRHEAMVLATHGGVVRAVQALVAGETAATMGWPAVGNAAVLEVALPYR